MKKISKQHMQYVLNAFTVIVGTFCMGFAFNVFLDSKNISPAGFSGLCSIISHVLQSRLGVNIPASVIFLVINVILFCFAYKKLGTNFAINSIIGILTYSLFIQVCNFDIGLGSEDLLLCAIYGGVVMGIGLGLVFRGKGSTGGSEMLASMLGKKFKFLTVGNFVLIIDGVVVLLSFIAYQNLDLALYSLIAIWIMAKVSDVIVSGVQGVRAYYIISKNSEEIAGKIMSELERGVTGFKAEGVYSKSEQTVLMTLVTRHEAAKLRQIVSGVDKSAFMYSTPISEALGNGFIPFKEDAVKKKKNKKQTSNKNNKVENTSKSLNAPKEENNIPQNNNTTENNQENNQEIIDKNN